MDKATVTKLRSIDAQIKAYQTKLIEIMEEASHSNDKHHLNKARRKLGEVREHLKVAVVGLQDQVNSEIVLSRL